MGMDLFPSTARRMCDASAVYCDGGRSGLPGTFSAPGMWPVANSRGERASNTSALFVFSNVLSSAVEISATFSAVRLQTESRMPGKSVAVTGDAVSRQATATGRTGTRYRRSMCASFWRRSRVAWELPAPDFAFRFRRYFAAWLLASPDLPSFQIGFVKPGFLLCLRLGNAAINVPIRGLPNVNAFTHRARRGRGSSCLQQPRTEDAPERRCPCGRSLQRARRSSLHPADRVRAVAHREPDVQRDSGPEYGLVGDERRT